ncbi:MAG: TerB family tellurite resistance protein [Alphaproteobacteria bacterium]|jgi:uncharacterized tellurite resistance protein B-like protein|nr:TerB family tellurite resistance protein [Alphaproteobacteria bacterium]
MLDRLRKIFEVGGPSTEHPGQQNVDDLHLAAAVLLIEAARMDDTFDSEERVIIANLVRSKFDLSENEASLLINLANQVAEDSIELSRFTKKIRDSFGHDDRVEMLEMLWRVVLADGKLHDHEASLLRRAAGLLYVTDKENGEAKKRAIELTS